MCTRTFSRRLLGDERLERYLSEIVEDLALADGQLSACIAQPLVMHPARSLPETLESLRARGIRLVLTDVGNEHDATDIVPHGFAELRLSREIVVDCDVDAARALVVRETAAFARGLGLAVSAVAVETPAQFDVVAEAGCDLAVGHLFGVPVPAR